MMRNAIVAIVMAVVAGTHVVDTRAPVRFADATWGSTKAETRQKLEAVGFKYQGEEQGGALEFVGPLPSLNENATVFAAFTPGNQLVKVRANVTVPDERVLEAYHALEEFLARAYGPPLRDVKQFTYPYNSPGRAPGHEIEAIRDGRARFMAFWAGFEDGNISIAITNQAVIQLDYESPGWPLELSRRQAIPGWEKDPCC